MLVGIGFDIHRLVKGRRLILGGVTFKYPRGLLGHSDGDVLLHAICDGILGAAGLGDIGDYFPPTDPRYKNLESAVFLKKVFDKINRLRLKVQRVDTIIFAEEPKLGTRKLKIKTNLARLLKIPAQRVNVKAKTMEGLGVIGAKRAIAAVAIVSLSRKSRQ